MPYHQIVCTFKNGAPYAELLRFLNKIPNVNVKGVFCNQINDGGKNEEQMEIRCSRKQAERIRLRWTKSLPAKYRSIWFMYQPLFDSESFQLAKYKYNEDVSTFWSVGCDAGTMISYNLFQCYSSPNFLYRLEIDRDQDERPVRIVLVDEEYEIKIRIRIDLLHKNVLLNFDRIENRQSASLILMLRGSPEIHQINDKKNTSERIVLFREFTSAQRGIIQCMDLHLEFQCHRDAWDFLQQLHLYQCPKKLEFNFTHLEINKMANSRKAFSYSPSELFVSPMGYYGMQMLSSLGQLFLAKYHHDATIQVKFLSYHKSSERKFYHFCCELWATLKNNHCCSILDLLRDHCEQFKHHSFKKSSVYEIPHIIITPSRLLLQPMRNTTGHRALRKYDRRSGYRWMLVHIRDEDEQSMLNNMNDEGEIKDRYEEILEQGFRMHIHPNEIATYHCFGWSGSQAKKAEFWSLALVNGVDRDSIFQVHQARNRFGNISTIRNVSTYVARVGLYLSTTKPTNIKFTYMGDKNQQCNNNSNAKNKFRKNVIGCSRSTNPNPKYKAYLIDDIHNNGYCFTDGVGTMGLGIAYEIARSIGIPIHTSEDVPSAYQVRIAGCKGMLSLKPGSTMDDYDIRIRKSMMKFNINDWSLEYVDHSKKCYASLNNQIIRLLYDLHEGNANVMKDLQKKCFLEKCSSKNKNKRVYRTNLDQEDEKRRENYCNSSNLLQNKIPLPTEQARFLFGIADETQSLQEGQCFIQYQSSDGKSYKTVTGDILVTKNPCLYPGDIRRLKAVHVPALEKAIRNCIVFPTRGKRPHFNQIAGSDLDGDQYWVYWGGQLKVPQMMKPLQYETGLKLEVPYVTPSLVTEYVLNSIGDSKSGIIANTHYVIADKHPQGTKSEECTFLAELFARTIDSGKTGESIDMDEVIRLRKFWGDQYPRWMQKQDKPSYSSNSINEILFKNAFEFRRRRKASSFQI